MAKLRFSLDDRDLKKKLDQIERAANKNDRFLKRAGMVVLRSTDERFKLCRKPDGGKWKDITDFTKANRKKGPSEGEPIPLQDNGTLKNSVTPIRGPGNIWKPTQNYIDVGTNVPYANIHQFGCGPFTIKSKGKKSLRFFGKDGKPVYRKKINHPGIVARPFLGINQNDQKQIEQTYIDSFRSQLPS